jgi:Ran GTPase-activating protein (RanGAP) involved in mRNA processing and transport
MDLLERIRSSDPKLTVVNLYHNNVGDEGARDIADALKHNTTLEWLYLSDNNIGDEGACAFADALKHNTTLIELDISVNNIGDEGVCAFADALKHNTRLHWLELSNNNIGDASIVKDINDEISVNKSKKGDKYNAKVERLRQTRGRRTKACRKYTPKSKAGEYVT